MNQTRRIEITVHGEVQRVGYRYIVQNVARRLKIQGAVQNMPDGTVRIIAEAPQKLLNQFIEKITIKEPPILVEKIDTKHSKATGKFKHFTIKYGELVEEISEGFGTGLRYINLSRAETKNGFQTLRTETKNGFQTVGNEIKEMREGMNKSFQLMSTKYDAISENLAQAIKTLQEESVKTRTELTRAVDSLSKLVEEFLRQRRKNAKENK